MSFTSHFGYFFRYLVIHIVFVPYIFWGLILLTNYGPNLIENKHLEAVYAPINIGFIATLVYVLYYIYLGDYIVALSYDVILIAISLHANYTFQSSGPAQAWIHVLLSQIIGWGLQVVVGHQMVEKRKPALLDSLFDSIVMAPLFTWYEVLFMCGFRREFKEELDREIHNKLNILASGKHLKKQM